MSYNAPIKNRSGLIGMGTDSILMVNIEDWIIYKKPSLVISGSNLGNFDTISGFIFLAQNRNFVNKTIYARDRDDSLFIVEDGAIDSLIPVPKLMKSIYDNLIEVDRISIASNESRKYVYKGAPKDTVLLRFSTDNSFPNFFSLSPKIDSLVQKKLVYIRLSGSNEAGKTFLEWKLERQVVEDLTQYIKFVERMKQRVGLTQTNSN